MIINRALKKEITSRFFKGKVIIVLGARQVGKSTLMESVLQEYENKYKILKLNGDESDIRSLFENPTSTKLQAMVSGNEIVYIDEAQRIEDIGIVLKLLVDNLKNIQIIVTGSSSFELSNKINEPLTGRKYEFMLYPLSFEEMVNHKSIIEEKRLLETRLIYGYYPEIVVKPGEATDLLKWLAGSYLYKDILALENINKPHLLEKILKAIALQVGNEVNYNELGQLVNANNETVEKYIHLLEKAFILFQLPTLSKNVRNEIKKGKKIYFYDNGIRNAVIGNFNPVSSRTDLGALFENYLISERIKYLSYKRENKGRYFWRTTQQQEIDYVEEHLDEYELFEFKWNPRKKTKFSTTFTDNYKVRSSKVVNSENYDKFLI